MNTLKNYDRIAHSSARQLLQKMGYQVEKSTNPQSRFHLIAWKGESEIIFIRIRRSRKPGAIQFPEDVKQLSELVRLRAVPGNVEFWVLSYGKWNRYSIFAGGALPREIRSSR